MIGKRLKELRVLKGLTRIAVAQYLNIDQTTYGKYELDKREPDYILIIKLADFFDVSVDDLLGRTSLKYISNSELSESEMMYSPVNILSATNDENQVDALSEDERSLLKYYRMLPKNIKAEIRGEVKGLARAKSLETKDNI